jgi:hypothetical protein
MISPSAPVTNNNNNSKSKLAQAFSSPSSTTTSSSASPAANHNNKEQKQQEKQQQQKALPSTTTPAVNLFAPLAPPPLLRIPLLQPQIQLQHFVKSNQQPIVEKFNSNASSCSSKSDEEIGQINDVLFVQANSSDIMIPQHQRSISSNNNTPIKEQQRPVKKILRRRIHNPYSWTETTIVA